VNALWPSYGEVASVSLARATALQPFAPFAPPAVRSGRSSIALIVEHQRRHGRSSQNTA
jgi:hypothetical protein